MNRNIKIDRKKGIKESDNGFKIKQNKQRLSINLAQDLSDHASELLWGQGFLVTHGQEKGNERLQELVKYNRFEEQFPYLEKLLSLFGNIYTTIDMVDGKPTVVICDPILNSQFANPNIPGPNSAFYGMGRAMVSDEIAVIWKRITYGSVTFAIKEIRDKNKVKRIFFGSNNKQITIGAVNKQLPEHMQLKEEWVHNTGSVLTYWHKNLPTFNAPSLPDGYKGAAAQALIDKTLSELWHETETNRTRIIGTMDETTFNEAKKKGNFNDLNKNDFLINVKFKNSKGERDNQLIPILADPKFDMYWLSINKAKDEYYQLGGYSPLGDGNVEKTATENLLMKTNDYQTTKKKRNLRLAELTNLFNDMILLDTVQGMGAIYGLYPDKDLTLEIMENKVMDSLNEITNLKLMIDAGFMSRVEAISQIRGISKEEATQVLQDIIKEKEQYADTFEPMSNDNQNQNDKKDDKEA